MRNAGMLPFKDIRRKSCPPPFSRWNSFNTKNGVSLLSILIKFCLVVTTKGMILPKEFPASLLSFPWLPVG